MKLVINVFFIIILLIFAVNGEFKSTDGELNYVLSYFVTKEL
jgi:hypothetical protein